MRRLAFVLAAFSCGLLARELVPSTAHADKTVTYLSAGVAWDQYTAVPDPAVAGGIIATQCAHALVQGGGNGPVICETTQVGPASQVSIDTLAVVNTRGIPFWKTRQGL